MLYYLEIKNNYEMTDYKSNETQKREKREKRNKKQNHTYCNTI